MQNHIVIAVVILANNWFSKGPIFLFDLFNRASERCRELLMQVGYQPRRSVIVQSEESTICDNYVGSETITGSKSPALVIYYPLLAYRVGVAQGASPDQQFWWFKGDRNPLLPYITIDGTPQFHIVDLLDSYNSIFLPPNDGNPDPMLKRDFPGWTQHSDFSEYAFSSQSEQNIWRRLKVRGVYPTIGETSIPRGEFNAGKIETPVGDTLKLVLNYEYSGPWRSDIIGDSVLNWDGSIICNSRYVGGGVNGDRVYPLWKYGRTASLSPVGASRILVLSGEDDTPYTHPVISAQGREFDKVAVQVS